MWVVVVKFSFRLASYIINKFVEFYTYVSDDNDHYSGDGGFNPYVNKISHFINAHGSTVHVNRYCDWIKYSGQKFVSRNIDKYINIIVRPNLPRYTQNVK